MLLQFMLTSVLVFSFKSLTVSQLAFNSLILFEFILMQNVRECPFFFFLTCHCSVSQHLLKILLSIVYSCNFCCRLLTRNMSLFGGILSCSIDLYSFFFVPVPYFYDYHSFEVQSEVREADSSCSVFLSQDCFGSLGSFLFPCKFKIFFSTSVKMPLVICQRLH